MNRWQTLLLGAYNRIGQALKVEQTQAGQIQALTAQDERLERLIMESREQFDANLKALPGQLVTTLLPAIVNAVIPPFKGILESATARGLDLTPEQGLIDSLPADVTAGLSQALPGAIQTALADLQLSPTSGAGDSSATTTGASSTGTATDTSAGTTATTGATDTSGTTTATTDTGASS